MFTPRDQRNFTQFFWWMTAAMIVFAATTILIDGFLVPSSVGWGLTAATVVLTLFTVRAYMHFLRNADELLRKIHLEALALAFGAGAVAMMGYRLCERLGAPKLDVNDPFLVMVLFWFGGQYLGARKYAVVEEP